MKTISGNCVSSKQVSLSKAAKILSKFVDAENGASHVIGAYLHRASAAFNELNEFHKELKSSHSHKKKHKRHRTEEGDHDDSGRVVENSVRGAETNQELNHDGNVQSKNKFKRQRFGKNNDEGDEKSTQTDVKFSQELNGSIGDHAGNSDGTEKHKKHKKHKRKKQEI